MYRGDFFTYNYRNLFYIILILICINLRKKSIEKLEPTKRLLNDMPEDNILLISNGNKYYINDSKVSCNQDYDYVIVGDELRTRLSSNRPLKIKKRHLESGQYINVLSNNKGTYFEFSNVENLFFSVNLITSIIKIMKYLFYVFYILALTYGLFNKHVMYMTDDLSFKSWYSYYDNYSSEVQNAQYTDPKTNIASDHIYFNITCAMDEEITNLSKESIKISTKRRYIDGFLGGYSGYDDGGLTIDCTDNSLYNEVKSNFLGSGFYKVNQNIDPGWYYYISSEYYNFQLNSNAYVTTNNPAKLLYLEDEDVIEVVESAFLIKKDLFNSEPEDGLYPAADYIVGENLDAGTYEMSAFDYILPSLSSTCNNSNVSNYSILSKEQFLESNNNVEMRSEFRRYLDTCQNQTIEVNDGDYLLLDGIVLKKVGAK